MLRQLLPYAEGGQVIGLFGGSFDPPHEGHVHVTREALKRFGLDRVWWLVSPGNPLKAHGPQPLEARMAASRALLSDPRVAVSDIERHIGTAYTAQTLVALQSARPDLKFVWLMGADNLAQFHRWQDWTEIMEHVPIGVIARPGARISARFSKAARVYAGARIPARDSRKLGHANAPAWCFVNVPMSRSSSTALRAAGKW